MFSGPFGEAFGNARKIRLRLHPVAAEDVVGAALGQSRMNPVPVEEQAFLHPRHVVVLRGHRNTEFTRVPADVVDFPVQAADELLRLLARRVVRVPLLCSTTVVPGDVDLVLGAAENPVPTLQLHHMNPTTADDECIDLVPLALVVGEAEVGPHPVGRRVRNRGHQQPEPLAFMRELGFGDLSETLLRCAHQAGSLGWAVCG